MACFPVLPCLTTPLGEPVRLGETFWVKLTPRKLEDLAIVRWKLHDPNFNCFAWFTLVTDG